MAVLVNPVNASTETTLRDVEAAARTMGLHIQVRNASTSLEINAAFAQAISADGVATVAAKVSAATPVHDFNGMSAMVFLRRLCGQAPGKTQRPWGRASPRRPGVGFPGEPWSPRKYRRNKICLTRLSIP